MPFFVTGKDFFFLLLFQLPIFFNENILKVLVGKNHIDFIYSESSLRDEKKPEWCRLKFLLEYFFQIMSRLKALKNYSLCFDYDLLLRI